jgi:hypothetical protein
MAIRKILIKFSENEWLDINKRRIGYKRKKLSAHFDSILSVKLQKQEKINCFFKSRFKPSFIFYLNTLYLNAYFI